MNECGELIEQYYMNSYGILNSDSYINNLLPETKIVDMDFISSLNINRIIYKGYYCDSEIGMYYLKNRYYNPYTGLFLTPDNINYIDFNNHLNYNLYTYCLNNPVMYNDPDGNFAILTALLIGTIVIGVEVGIGVITYNIWKENDYIEINENNIEIKKSWLIQGHISKLVFLLMLRNSSKYNEKYNENNESVRSLFSIWLEWDLHNIAGNLLFVGILLSAFPSLLTSNTSILGMMITLFQKSYDVDIENSDGWWKIWERLN